MLFQELLSMSLELNAQNIGLKIGRHSMESNYS